jgi:DNA-binding HxlR family transcriptional regulator
MAISETALRNPGATGLASTVILTALMRTLVEKGMLSRTEADNVFVQASAELGVGGPSLYRAAKTIVDEAAKSFAD